MNTKVVWGIVAVVVVVALGWYLMQGSPSSTSSSESATQSGAATESQAGSGTLGSLLAMGSVQCEVTTDDAQAAGQGTVYVAGGKMRGNFSSTMQGKTMHAYMINDGSTIYSWTDVTPQGFKTAVSAGTASSGSGSQGVSTDTRAQYSCKPWSVDASVFVPPSTITFMTAGGMPMAPR